MTGTVGAGAARTLLFVPGDRPDRFAKAAATPADLVICDLEDAVSQEHKETARHEVAAWLGGSGGGRAAVRVNAIATGHYAADRDALSRASGLQAVVVPKSEDPAALTALHTALGDVPVIALIETAVGIDRAREISGADGVARLAFGSIDLSVDLGSSEEDDALLMARSTLVLASRLARIAPPLDGVTTELHDGSLAAKDAARAGRLGFGGKLCIHPRQVEPVNAAFTPTAAEIAWATRILEAGSGGGAVQVDGQMVDQPVLDRAAHIIARAGGPGVASPTTGRNR